MNLIKKEDKIIKLKSLDYLIKSCTAITYSDFNEIKFALFELKEAIYRLNEYFYYSDQNPFYKKVSYVRYSRFIYESYLNDTYILQTRLIKLINVTKGEKRFNFFESETKAIEEKFSKVIKLLQKITKDKRGEHVHQKRYNDENFMISDLMEHQNEIVKKISGKPIKEKNGKDIYYYVTVDHLNDVQDLIIENNNYIYETIDLFLKDLLDVIVNKIIQYIDDTKKV